jgi:hydantoinase/carbamoylase family amidase
MNSVNVVADLRAERTLARLEELFAIGDGPHACRPGLSPEEERACELAAGWMRDAGLEVTWDDAGNVVGRALGTQPELPEVWTGSHLDTVPAGGRFDGALGVVGGLEAVSAAQAAGALRRTVAVAAFRDEEGWRFGRGLFGSRALCGRLVDGEQDDRDADGVSLGDAVAALGRTWPRGEGRLVRSIDAFVELHIEQGPVLAARDAPLGVVSDIAGMSGFEVTLNGTAGHAGTTPMDVRNDAVAAAARFIQGLQGAARDIDGAVATVGQIAVAPGASNVVPDEVRLSVDARAPTDERLDGVEAAVHAQAEAAATAEGCTYVVRHSWRLPAAPMHPRVREALRAGVAAAGAEPVEIVSGAGHDAQVFEGAGIPTGMLFVRSLANGISHNPDEHTDASAIGQAIAALAATLRTLAA